MDNSDIFLRSGIDKQLKIYTGDRSISFTNSDLYFQEFQLEESICDEESIKFGYLHASSIQFKVANSFIPLKSKWLKVDFVLDKDDSNTYPVGKFKVAEDTPAADRRYRTVKCYDALYDVINADVSAWYNALFSTDDTKVTLKTFRNSFFSYFGIEQTDISLVNDAIVIDKTISPDELSGKVVLSAILELNGCLGHIGRDAKFHYIYLEQEIQGLYPRDDLYPADDLYPRDVKTSPIGKSVYKKCEYQDFITKSIDKLQIRKEENDIGVIVGSGNNAYVIEDNFLVYGKSTSDLEIIANNIYKKIIGIRYRPFKAECIGNLLFDLGKPVRLVTKYEMIETYIFSRTLTGIQQLSDSYSAKGTEYQQQKINSTSKSIKELKGKTNTLFRSVEETRLEIKDLDQNLSSKITQNAQKIELEVTRATSAENSLSSRITQTAEQISLEVTRATSAESSLSAAIQVNANNINLKVSKGDVSSEISQEAGQITIKSNRLIVESTQFKLDANGNATYSGTLSAASGSFSGTVTATSGTFDNVTINSSCTVAGQSISGAITNASWQGSSIGDAYLSDISGSKVGSGFSAGNMTAGTVGRPYRFGVTKISETQFEATSASIPGSLGIYQLNATRPSAAGGSQIGSSAHAFDVAYISAIHGTIVGSVSSRTLKSNIDDYNPENCLDVINNTKIVSYNYNSDLNILNNIENIVENLRIERDEYINKLKEILCDDEEKLEAEIQNIMDEYEEKIKDKRDEVNHIPEKRYGFISEDAPWELVAKDRKSVDIYSAIAMCFGAIQLLDKRLQKLET